MSLTLSNVQRQSRDLLLHVRKKARCRELADERLFGRLCHDVRPLAKKVSCTRCRWNSRRSPCCFWLRGCRRAGEAWFRAYRTLTISDGISGSAGPGVCRLSAGGRRIRTLGPPREKDGEKAKESISHKTASAEWLNRAVPTKHPFLAGIEWRYPSGIRCQRVCRFRRRRHPQPTRSGCPLRR